MSDESGSDKPMFAASLLRSEVFRAEVLSLPKAIGTDSHIVGAERWLDIAINSEVTETERAHLSECDACQGMLREWEDAISRLLMTPSLIWEREDIEPPEQSGIWSEELPNLFALAAATSQENTLGLIEIPTMDSTGHSPRSWVEFVKVDQSGEPEAWLSFAYPGELIETTTQVIVTLHQNRDGKESSQSLLVLLVPDVEDTLFGAIRINSPEPGDRLRLSAVLVTGDAGVIEQSPSSLAKSWRATRGQNSPAPLRSREFLQRWQSLLVKKRASNSSPAIEDALTEVEHMLDRGS